MSKYVCVDCGGEFFVWRTYTRTDRCEDCAALSVDPDQQGT